MAHDLQDFLKRADRLGEHALVYSSKLNLETVLQSMEQVYGDRHIFTLRAGGPLPTSETEVAETIRNSFEGRGVLAVFVNASMPQPVLKVVERLARDGRLTKDNQPLTPPADWRLILLAQVDDPAVLPGELGTLFPATIALP
jgi:hypothetical protein